MKHLKVIITLLTLITLFSCKDNSIAPTTNQKKDLVGYWQITKNKSANSDEDTPVHDVISQWNYHFTETDSIFVISSIDTMSGTWKFKNNNKNLSSIFTLKLVVKMIQMTLV